MASRSRDEYAEGYKAGLVDGQKRCAAELERILRSDLYVEELPEPLFELVENWRAE